jgi:hypothetical protein
MATPSATYTAKPGEGKARSRKQAKDKVWTAEDAQQALSDGKRREESPEAEDAFSPTPPHHPEGTKMAARPPGTSSHRPSSDDLWAEAEKLAEERKAEEAAERVAGVAETPTPQPEVVETPASYAPSTTPEAADLVAAAMQQAKQELTEQIGIDPIVLAKLTAYLNDRCRVTLELQDGTFSMPVINIVKSKYSLTLLIPIDPKATTFVPKPGTRVVLTSGDFCEEVYFPGAYAEVEPLTIAIMTFVRTAEDNAEA